MTLTICGTKTGQLSLASTAMTRHASHPGPTTHMKTIDSGNILWITLDLNRNITALLSLCHD